MDITAVLDRLLDAQVSLWLNLEGKLRIDKDAPKEIKDLVREHKQALVEFRKAYALLESSGVRIIRLPLSESALAHPPRANLSEIRLFAAVLGLGSLPLVVDDEGLAWISYEEWRRRQPLWSQQDRIRYRRDRAAEQAAEEQARQKRRRKTA